MVQHLPWEEIGVDYCVKEHLFHAMVQHLPWEEIGVDYCVKEHLFQAMVQHLPWEEIGVDYCVKEHLFHAMVQHLHWEEIGVDYCVKQVPVVNNTCESQYLEKWKLRLLSNLQIHVQIIYWSIKMSLYYRQRNWHEFNTVITMISVAVQWWSNVN
jgi:hypothetical protein